MIVYREVNGTSYHADTNEAIINVLEWARLNDTRIRVYYGDTLTGLDWQEQHRVTGYVGRSTGRAKIPLLVYSKRCCGGGGILDNCIVRIETTRGGRVLYNHPNYHTVQLSNAQ